MKVCLCSTKVLLGESLYIVLCYIIRMRNLHKCFGTWSLTFTHPQPITLGSQFPKKVLPGIKWNVQVSTNSHLSNPHPKGYMWGQVPKKVLARIAWNIQICREKLCIDLLMEVWVNVKKNPVFQIWIFHAILAKIWFCTQSQNLQHIPWG